MKLLSTITLALWFALSLWADARGGREFSKAPDFSNDAVWIDAGAKAPHSIKGYHGRVLLIDFWEYTCINCIRDFAVVRNWYDKYHSYGFDVVGVHYGEFPMGFNAENVRKAARRFQFPWPVLADINGSVWNAYHARAWPTRLLISPNGEIVMKIEGEVNNDVLEANIRTLLALSRPEVREIPRDPKENTFDPQCGVATDEMYVGDWQGSGRGSVQNSQGYRDGSDTDFRSEAEPREGRVMLSGKWRTERDGVFSSAQQVSAVIRYQARSVYAVLSVKDPRKPVRLFLQQDGKDLERSEAGADVRFDVQTSYIEISEPRMYYLVQNSAFGSHLLSLQASDKGLGLHSFTFGNSCQQNFSKQ